jgi:hypothetical protein
VIPRTVDGRESLEPAEVVQLFDGALPAAYPLLEHESIAPAQMLLRRFEAPLEPLGDGCGRARARRLGESRATLSAVRRGVPSEGSSSRRDQKPLGTSNPWPWIEKPTSRSLTPRSARGPGESRAGTRSISLRCGSRCSDLPHSRDATDGMWRMPSARLPPITVGRLRAVCRPCERISWVPSSICGRTASTAARTVAPSE